MDSGIYQLTFPNGQFYIGKSENIPKRWKTHSVNFSKGTHTKKMQAVYNEYGPPEYRVVLEVHPDHIDIYESILIAAAWGPQLLNTTKPKPISSEDAGEYLHLYDNFSFNDTSVMLWSTLDQVKTLKKVYLEKLDLEGVLQALRDEGLLLPDEIRDRYHQLEDTIEELQGKVQRLQNRTLWQRLWNQIV